MYDTAPEYCMKGPLLLKERSREKIVSCRKTQFLLALVNRSAIRGYFPARSPGGGDGVWGGGGHRRVASRRQLAVLSLDGRKSRRQEGGE